LAKSSKGRFVGLSSADCPCFDGRETGQRDAILKLRRAIRKEAGTHRVGDIPDAGLISPDTDHARRIGPSARGSISAAGFFCFYNSVNRPDLRIVEVYPGGRNPDRARIDRLDLRHRQLDQRAMLYPAHNGLKSRPPSPARGPPLGPDGSQTSPPPARCRTEPQTAPNNSPATPPLRASRRSSDHALRGARLLETPPHGRKMDILRGLRHDPQGLRTYRIALSRLLMRRSKIAKRGLAIQVRPVSSIRSELVPGLLRIVPQRVEALRGRLVVRRFSACT